MQYCFAAYSAGDYKLATEVMASIHEIIDTAERAMIPGKTKAAFKPHELNELLLFNALLIEKATNVKKSIKFLTAAKNRKNILDDVAYNERLASLYCQNNQKPKALDCLNELIAINPNNEATYRSVLEAKDLDVNNKEHHA